MADMIGRLRFLGSRSDHRLIPNPTTWLSILLVVGMLLFSIALPFLPGRGYHIYLAGLVAGIAIVLAFLRWPPLGLVAVIVAGLVIPFEISTGSNTSVNASILLLILLIGLWLLDMIAKKRQIRLVHSRTMRPLVALIVVSILSLFMGQFPFFAFSAQSAPLTAQLGGLAIIVLSASAFLLVANQVHETKWLEWMTWTFLALGAFFIAGWLLPGPVGQITGRLFQRGAIAGGMFWVWLVALAFSQAVINKKLHPGWRLALGALVAATLYVGFFLNSGWKSGYIPPMVAVAAIIIFRSWRAGLALALIGILPAQKLILDAIATDQYSYSTRIDAWLIMLEIIKVSPVLGLGLANYRWYTPLFPIRGYAVSFSSHNQYVDLVAQTGLLGLAMFLWFAFEVGRLGLRLRNQVSAGFEQAYVYGVLGGLAGTLAAGMLADWVLPFVYNVGFRGFRASILAWLFLGGLVSLEAITRRRVQSEQPAPGK